MKVAYFDCQFGAAGDMLCASLLASGLNFELWQAELHKIALPEGSFEVAAEDVMRCLVAAKKIVVKCHHSEHSHGDGHQRHEHAHHHEHEYEQKHDRENEHDRVHDHAHDHAHHHEPVHKHNHEHDVSHEALDTHHHEGPHGRSVKEILAIIEASGISARAKSLSCEIFRNLAISEGRVHGVEPENVHFHEVGAVDAIVDIVGFCVGYTLLGIEKSVVSPLTLGGGTVRTQHGLYPVPGPATAYLVEMAGAPVNSLDIRFECLTPTGAAILATIADSWGAAPSFEKIDSIGYGAGTLNPPSHPNVVRTFIGNCSSIAKQSFSSQYVQLGENSELAYGIADGAGASILGSQSDHTANGELNQFRIEIIAVIEANVDDCPPNIIAYTLEKALAEGALDISVVPATMKKGRSGHLITVLAKPQDRRKLETLILKETSSLGVRSYLVERLVAEREFAEVKLSESWSIRIKIGRDLNGNIVNLQPEYADCATYAERHGLPLKEVFEQALAQYMTGQAAF
jgi:hypothetical protein